MREVCLVVYIYIYISKVSFLPKYLSDSPCCQTGASCPIHITPDGRGKAFVRITLFPTCTFKPHFLASVSRSTITLATPRLFMHSKRTSSAKRRFVSGPVRRLFKLPYRAFSFLKMASITTTNK